MRETREFTVFLFQKTEFKLISFTTKVPSVESITCKQAGGFKMFIVCNYKMWLLHLKWSQRVSSSQSLEGIVAVVYSRANITK